MAKLLYQGHASFRLTTGDGAVIYLDPFAGEGYSLPADLILVTHEHSDHNQVSLPAKKPGYRILRAKDALAGGEYRTFSLCGVKIESVPAYNQNHDRRECVGFLLEADGVSLYFAGDTSETEAMRGLLPGKCLDYAFLPVDGVYNMDAAAASGCAELIGAAHSVPIHTAPGQLYDRHVAERFMAKGRLLLRPGEEIEL